MNSNRDQSPTPKRVMETLGRKPWVSARAVERLQNALLRGFDARLSPEEPLFRLLLLRHVVCQMIVQRTSGWGTARTFFNRFLWWPYERWLRALP